MGTAPGDPEAWAWAWLVRQPFGSKGQVLALGCGIVGSEGQEGRGWTPVAAGTHQLLQLPLPVTQLLVHALAHVCALQG